LRDGVVLVVHVGTLYTGAEDAACLLLWYDPTPG